MADVFISYAKADRPLALKLAAMLEAEGWTTWWDTSLTIGDDFRNEIMTELGRARAVIVIWTDTSIKSDWVRSEAGRAQADRKLIPVKLPHLAYKDLPPPFDVLHTENIGEEDKIKAAVVAQLAKPAVEPTAWGLLAKGLKWELLTWWGIVGGAITLFVAISTTLKLADWARILVEHWKEWTHAFWLWMFGWFGIRIAPEWAAVLTFLLFGSFLTLGQAFTFRRTFKHLPTVPWPDWIFRAPAWQRAKSKEKSFQLISWRTLLYLVLVQAYRLVLRRSIWSSLPDTLLIPVLPWDLLPDDLSLFLARLLPVAFVHLRTIAVILYLGIFLWPPLIIGLLARHKLHAVLSAFMVIIFWWIIVFNQLVTIYSSGDGGMIYDNFGFRFRDRNAEDVAFLLWWVLPLIALLVAPAKAISRRLIFLALGLLLLIALNELSKLGLDVTAPKVQG